MRALVYHRYGGPEELHVEEHPTPSPGKGEILVKVAAASLNSWDWDLLTGRPLIVRAIGGGFLRPRLVLGCDLAGTVVAVGEGVAEFGVGDRVFGDVSGGKWGGFAEYAVAQAAIMARLPNAIGFDEASALPQAGVLALQGLRDYGRIERGMRVLINGAGGGVGTIAVQCAKMVGAEVTAVDRGEKLAALSRLGADHVIDYTSTDFTDMGERYDLILDNVAWKPLLAYRRALTPNGRCVFVGGNIAKILFGSLVFRQLKILAHKPNRADLDLLAGLVAEGQIAPVIDKCFPLERGAEAFRCLGAGEMFGKLVIRPQD